jgi:pimeloyl-ACP methyl ester carboxylesterase
MDARKQLNDRGLATDTGREEGKDRRILGLSSLQETSWEEAWDRARATLEGTTRHAMCGASDEVRLGVLDWGGEGDVVVLHHANGFCAATLAPIASAMRDRFRVFSIDARGHGDSTPIAPGGDPNPYDWDTLAEDLAEVVRQILALAGRDQVAVAIGHSFGGALLLRAASDEPELFERILLCDPVILPPMTSEEQAVRSNSTGLAAATRKRRDRFPSRAAAYEHCRSRGLFANFSPEALALYVGEGMAETPDGEIMLKCDREVEAAIFDGGVASAVSEGVSRVSGEVVFVHAQRGNFPLETFKGIAAGMKNARVDSLDVGHLFPLEDPGRVLGYVTQWVKPV